MADTLPAELGDRIIDFLHNDREALLACSLTCRRWLPAVRYHVWSHTRLERNRLLRFVNLIIDEPELASFISHLDMYDRSGSFRKRLGTLQPHNSAEFDLVMKVLPGLRTLQFQHTLVLDELADIAATNSTFCALEGLSFLNCDFETSDTAAKMLAVPSLTLKSITLCDPQLMSCRRSGALALASSIDWVPPVEVKPPTPQRLSLSSLSNTVMRGLFDWVSASATCLQLIIRNDVEASIAGTMLLSLGNVVTELDLIIDAHNNLAAVFSDAGFSLGCLQALRKCSLTINLREMFVSGNISVPWVSALLEQLASTSLKAITLKLRADTLEDLRALDSECGVREMNTVQFSDLEALDWGGLEDSANSGRLPSLQKIIVEGIGETRQFLSFMQVKHPMLRSMLQIRKVKMTVGMRKYNTF
ncbi:hypothetical protein BC835DRAFT_1411513 [Cytidiella melzeri]|nr:hypothetical protein BC835DRAFT_1411513 [Cytidiella melzeri]